MIAASLPGLAALGALLFTWMQVEQTSKQLRIAEGGQITTRFNVAIGNLGSSSLDKRLGGIYALQRIMQDSRRDHPTVVSVLAAFAQQHAGSSAQSFKEPLDERPDAHKPGADIRAAIDSLARRYPDYDAGTIIDLSKTDLRGLRFNGKAPIKLPGVNLDAVDLRWADFGGSFSLTTARPIDLRAASLVYANLEEAYLEKADLSGAQLIGARLVSADLEHANLQRADMRCAQIPGPGLKGEEDLYSDCVVLQGAFLNGADLRNAKMNHADLRDATLRGADLRGADLYRADLRNADLTHADFRGAKLTSVRLQGATRTGARGLPQAG
ncbi:pentapeptide repeat-containing protein [Streptomyces griseosporeus]